MTAFVHRQTSISSYSPLIAATISLLIALIFSNTEASAFALSPMDRDVSVRGAGSMPEFAYAKLFALTNNGKMYRLVKRDLRNGIALDTFAFGEQDRPLPGSDFAFAFNGNNKLAKRAASNSKFAKRSPNEGELVGWEEMSNNPRPDFARFAFRESPVLQRVPGFAFA